MKRWLYVVGALALIGAGSVSGCGTGLNQESVSSASLALSNISVSSITATSAVVTWSTNLTSTSIVEYGFTTAYGSATPLYGLTLDHQVPLTGLSSGTLYHFRVTSESSGTTRSSSDSTFSTLLSDGGVLDAGTHDGGDAGDAEAAADASPVPDGSVTDAGATMDSGTKDGGPSTGKPVCGLNNNQNPYIPGTTPNGGSSNWDTFVPPAVGQSYVDALTGCTVTRLTDSVGSGNAYVTYYSTLTPFNANNKYVMATNTNDGAWVILSGPGLSGVTPGTTVIANYPNDGRWDVTNPLVSYYASGTRIYKATLTGACTSTSNCSLTTTVLHDYASGTPTYTNISFQDEADMSQDGTTLQFDGLNASGHVDINTYAPATNTTTVWYTTTCTASNPLGTQPGCLHKILLSPHNEPIVGFANNGSGPETGDIWFHGTPGSATQTHIQNGTNHFDTGLDIHGTPIFIQGRVDSSIGTDPCPSGQWSGASGGGGAAMTYFTDPTNSSHDATCVVNNDWASPHFSYRGGPSQPWFTVSYFDTRSPSAEWFNNNSGHYVAPTCTQSNTTVGGSCWFPYQDEVDLVRINTDMNTAGTGPLSTVYRMAQMRSRSEENFWAQGTATQARDANYIAFNSNMAHPGGCTSSIQASNACADIYVISGPGGAPLFAP